MKIRKVVDKGDPKNKEEAYKFFVEEKGYSPEVALGIIGNLMQESYATLDTTAVGFDGTGSFGIAQWLGSRKEKLKEIRPDDFNTLRGQLEFIDWELNNTEKRAASKLKDAKTAEDAALIFSKYYERPHKDFAHNDKRVAYAKKLREELNIQNEVKRNNFEEKPKIEIDNTRVKTRDFIPLNISSKKATYAPLPEIEEKKENGISEEQVRKIFNEYQQTETKQNENNFLNSFQQQQPQEEYIPQQPQENLDYLYDYINIDDYADGGEKDCGGEGQPPCNEKKLSQEEINNVKNYLSKLRPMEVGKTANTLGSMLGNVNTYFFNGTDKDLKESPYRPTIEPARQKNGKIKEKYYSRLGMREDVFNDLTSDRVKKDYKHDGSFSDIHAGLKANGTDREHNADNAFPLNEAGYKGQYNRGHGSLIGEFNLGRYRTDAGEDERGKYISFVDKYDWNGLKTENAINFYDRIYEDEWENYKKELQK